MKKNQTPLAKRNARFLWLSAFIVVAMLGVSFAFVPLYRIMCQVFKIPVPRIAVGESAVSGAGIVKTDRVVDVRFVAEAARGVPIRFTPTDYKLRVHVGEPVLTAYTATNTSPRGIDGVAVHMVYSMGNQAKDGDVSRYIDLRQCFCFELQHYPGNEEKKLPLNFIITPDLPDDVHTITFAYTLFEALPNDPRIKKHTDDKKK
ncbi:MAG TPA: cytochrome c oxidase assembly protein [Alphaproteobacteria bacterium]|nr:cytochrome c oxidase assembly protein [Alphaproteobacteria bacterium]